MTDARTDETIEQRKTRIAMLRRLNSALPKEQRRAVPLLHEPERPMPDQAPSATIEFLLAMSRNNYMDLVCGDLAASKDDRWARLYLHPHLIQLTHSVLVRKRSTAARLTRDTRESAQSEVGRRRWRFIEMLESRLQQVEAALPDAVLTSDRNSTLRLFAAIQEHRRSLTTNGVEPEAWDLRLWRAADDLPDLTSHPDGPGEPNAGVPVR